MRASKVVAKLMGAFSKRGYEVLGRVLRRPRSGGDGFRLVVNEIRYFIKQVRLYTCDDGEKSNLKILWKIGLQ